MLQGTYMRDRQTLAMLDNQALPVSLMVWNLLKNPSYMLSVLAITNVMFVLIALQFWAVQYGIVVLNADPEYVKLTFSATIITAPCLGAIVGGLITSRLEGGYNNKNALFLCFIVYLLFCAFCIPCPFINNYTLFLSIIWVAIFMQGFIEPIMMGIILNFCSPVERPTASSLSILLEMLVGMMPASYVYGLVYEATAVYEGTGDDRKNVSRGGMYVTLFSVGVGAVALLIALLLKRRSVQGSVDGVVKNLKKTNPQITEEQAHQIAEGQVVGPDVPKILDVSNDHMRRISQI